MLVIRAIYRRKNVIYVNPEKAFIIATCIPKVLKFLFNVILANFVLGMSFAYMVMDKISADV